MTPAKDLSPHAQPGVYLTDDLPGIGGLLKQRDDDFLVEEIPAYQPCGQGEHIYLFVQKKGLSTQNMVQMLARHFRVPISAVGYAGLKDRHAITRQVVSIHAPGKVPEDFPSIKDDRIAVLWSDLHSNKLRRGHLLGNRFSIRVRGVALRAIFDAKKTLARLEALGVPNRVGPQRFGLLGNNHLVGRALLLGQHQEALDLILGPAEVPGLSEANTHARACYAAGDFAGALEATPRTMLTEQRLLRALAQGHSPKQACARIDPLALGFYISATQSAIFNRILDGRLSAGTLAQLLPGDLAYKHDNGAVFPITDAELADPDVARRLAKGEIAPSGPIWGPAMPRAALGIDQAELAALATLDLTPERIDLPMRSADAPGKRRPLRVPITHTDLEAGGDEHGLYIRLAFDLPPGAYATVVMQEIMKTNPQLDEHT